MADQLQLRRGTTAAIASFTGAQGEVIVDTDKNALVVQNGITAGGFATASSAQVTDGTFYYNENVGSIANAYILDPKANTNTPTAYLDGIQFGFVTTHPNTGPSTANFQSLGVRNLKFPGGIDPQPGEISGRVYVIYDAANSWLEIQQKASGTPPQLRSVTASVGSNALTVGLQPSVIDFRAASLGSGTVNRRTIVNALSLIVPAGATLGTQNGLRSRIAILAIDNAGTVQLGVANMNGATNFDETTLVNATAITAGSTSANVVYSSSAVAGAPFRVVGFVESIQAVAGTWITVPSEIQGQGGQAIIGASKITLAVSQPTTSGTALDFTGLLPGINRITVMFSGVSINAATDVLIQLGSGSVQNTGYLGTAISLTTAANAAVNLGAGFQLQVGAAARVFHGAITMNRISANTWVASGSTGFSSLQAVVSIGGAVTLAGDLDRVRLTTANGTATFTAGTVNILYEG